MGAVPARVEVETAVSWWKREGKCRSRYFAHFAETHIKTGRAFESTKVVRCEIRGSHEQHAGPVAWGFDVTWLTTEAMS